MLCPARMGAQPPGCASHPAPWLQTFPSHPVLSPESLGWALHAFLLVTGPSLSGLSTPLPSHRGCSSHPSAWQAPGRRFVPWELGLPLLPSFSRTLFLLVITSKYCT